jgi:hypothetical protein
VGLTGLWLSDEEEPWSSAEVTMVVMVAAMDGDGQSSAGEVWDKNRQVRCR